MRGGASGWIAKAALKFETNTSAPATPQGIEAAMPAWPIRDQLFSITEVKTSESGKSVSVTALRLFYDLRGNLTNYKTTVSVLAKGRARQDQEFLTVATDFDFYTDIVGTRTASIGLG
jgi:hypothetical protein